MENIISYTGNIPFVKRFFGISFILLGVIMLVLTGSLFTFIFIAIGLGLNIADGTDINLTNKSIRSFQSLFGIKYGKWKQIPNFEYVSVFKTNESQTIRVVTAETTLNSSVFLVNLFYNRNKHITFYKTTNKTKAFEVADHFKLDLEIDVLDATEKEKKWL
jgi:hypothetical protein